jgi:hypothetical protein
MGFEWILVTPEIGPNVSDAGGTLADGALAIGFAEGWTLLRVAPPGRDRLA